MRHPVNSGDIDKGQLSYIAAECSDLHSILAKEQLKVDGLGYVVEAIEQHGDSTTFQTSFEDSSMFTKAYTDDLLDCLGVAFEQNNQVMTKCDLADVLK